MNVTETMHLHVMASSVKRKPSFLIMSSKLEPDNSHGFFHVASKDVVFEVDENADFTPVAVESLKAQQRSIMAEAQAKATEIQGQINQLLAIEHKETA
jgi:hypothetical protein